MRRARNIALVGLLALAVLIGSGVNALYISDDKASFIYRITVSR